jgi:hypothetical protein
MRTSDPTEKFPRHNSLPQIKGAAAVRRHRVFLLSPANVAGRRAKSLLESSGGSPLASRLRREGASIGEVFSFLSELYFRGKLTYARSYADPPPGVPAILVITASGGLVSPEKPLTIEGLREMSAVPIDAAEPRYRIPLIRDAQLLSERMGADCQAVLLGSVATQKYVDPLLSVFGERLLFPSEFVGRGHMSRGGLMLRSERAGTELTYIPVAQAVRRGRRPPKLPPMASTSRNARRA